MSVSKVRWCSWRCSHPSAVDSLVRSTRDSTPIISTPFDDPGRSSFTPAAHQTTIEHVHCQNNNTEHSGSFAYSLVSTTSADEWPRLSITRRKKGTPPLMSMGSILSFFEKRQFHSRTMCWRNTTISHQSIVVVVRVVFSLRVILIKVLTELQVELIIDQVAAALPIFLHIHG